MSEVGMDCWISEKHRKQDLRRRKIATIKHNIYLWLHGLFWKTLWVTRLATPYSKFMCKRKLYRKFPDGRCMYCGVIK